MKVALVHDWLTGMRGGERCLEAFLKIYPDADIFTMFHVPESTSAEIDSRVKQVSPLNKLPGVKSYYRHLLPLFPMAIRQLDVSAYDLVISLSHVAAKNVPIRPGTKHVCYCFTPMRYIWDQSWRYFGRSTALLWPIIKLLRIWDRRSSKGVSHFIAISRFVAGRIRTYYGREARVIHPPVDPRWFEPLLRDSTPDKDRYFLYAGALVPYKGAGIAVEAFNILGLPLKIAGTGPLFRSLKSRAGPNVEFLGRVSDDELALLYRNCRALIFPAKEDFGLVPVECMAVGRPVIALYAGACKETVAGPKSWKRNENFTGPATGVFIQEGHPEGDVKSLLEGVSCFLEKEKDFSEEACRSQALKFSLDRFCQHWREFAATVL